MTFRLWRCFPSTTSQKQKETTRSISPRGRTCCGNRDISISCQGIIWVGGLTSTGRDCICNSVACWLCLSRQVPWLTFRRLVWSSFIPISSSSEHNFPFCCFRPPPPHTHTHTPPPCPLVTYKTVNHGMRPSKLNQHQGWLGKWCSENGT